MAVGFLLVKQLKHFVFVHLFPSSQTGFVWVRLTRKCFRECLATCCACVYLFVSVVEYVWVFLYLCLHTCVCAYLFDVCFVLLACVVCIFGGICILFFCRVSSLPLPPPLPLPLPLPLPRNPNPASAPASVSVPTVVRPLHLRQQLPQMLYPRTILMTMKPNVQVTNRTCMGRAIANQSTQIVIPGL